MSCRIDHLVITAPDLDSGAELVRRSLGIPLEQGGEHPRMGTHNRVLKLGNAVYLEVISPNPDPDAPKPERPRWFELDRMQPGRPPRLATWAARTTDIRSTLASSSEPLGHPEAMSRGPLSWLIAFPEDGSLPLGGVAPAIIEWRTDHPAGMLREVGCSLVRLELFHPDAGRISGLLESLAIEGNVSVASLRSGEPPHLVAHILTPSGPRTLR
jgi:Glyoxalase-like domain